MTKSPAPPDLAAATRLWADYQSARPALAAAGPEYTAEHFGDSADLADELLNLVLSGEKRATAELVSEFAARGDDLPRIGRTGSRATAPVRHESSSAQQNYASVTSPQPTPLLPSTKPKATAP